MNKCFAIQFVVLAAAVVGLRAFGAEKTEPEAKTDRVTIEDRGAAAQSGFSCSICLDTAKVGGVESETLPCGHRFCPDCIAPWIEASNNCPLCREAVDPLRSITEMFRGAAANGYPDFVLEVLNARVLPDIDVGDQQGRSALMYAAIYGHIEVVRRLLYDAPGHERAGVDVNRQDHEGRTALIFAASQGHTEIVELLLLRGANANLQDSQEGTAAFYAARDRHVDCVRALLEHNSSERTTILLWAASHGHLDIIEKLLAYGVDIEHQDQDGASPLMLAAFNGRLEVVKELLRQGANVNLRAANGDTALMLASQFGQTEVARALLYHESGCPREGVSVRLANARGETAGDHATREGFHEISQLLDGYLNAVSGELGR